MTAFPGLRGLPLSECRECAEPIRFVALDTGKALPVNPMPNSSGNVCARRIGSKLHGYVVSKTHGPDPLFLRFMPHHATCEERQSNKPRPADPALF